MENETTFGQKLRELRESAGISLRELARDAKISAPFLSDVELGRRFPKDATLVLITKKLGIEPETLKLYDTRDALGGLKRLADASPTLAFAFKEMVNQVNAGRLTPGDLALKLRNLCGGEDK